MVYVSENNNDTDISIKISFLGYSGSGKTSIIEKYLYGEFNYNVQATIGCIFQYKNINHNEHKILITINDTAGQEKFNSIPRMYYRGVNAFVIVYDITDERSFENIKYWLEDIHTHSNENNNIFIVGNKNDIQKNLRVHDELALKKILDDQYFDIFKNKNYSYMEVSAKTGINIHKLINLVVNKSINENKFEVYTKKKTFLNDSVNNCC